MKSQQQATRIIGGLYIYIKQVGDLVIKYYNGTIHHEVRTYNIPPDSAFPYHKLKPLTMYAITAEKFGDVWYWIDYVEVGERPEQKYGRSQYKPITFEVHKLMDIGAGVWEQRGTVDQMPEGVVWDAKSGCFYHKEKDLHYVMKKL